MIETMKIVLQDSTVQEVYDAMKVLIDNGAADVECVLCPLESDGRKTKITRVELMYDGTVELV